MSLFRSLFSCCQYKSNEMSELPSRRKGLQKVLPENNSVLKSNKFLMQQSTSTEASEQNQTVIFCYGNLSPFINMEQIPLELKISPEERCIKKIAVGESHFIALLGNGQLIGAGSNQYGQLGLPMSKEAENQEIMKLELINLACYDKKQTKIQDILAGSNHTVLFLKKNNNVDQIYSFGHSDGVGVDGIKHSQVPQEILINGLKNPIQKIYARYNTNLLIDSESNVYMWGEDQHNMKLRRPKHFHKFEEGIRQISIGKRHGIAITNSKGLYGWGDGTYGELGTQNNLPLEKPTQIEFFIDINIKEIAAGARHSLVLDYNGDIYAMGDNSQDQCAISGRRANEPEKILKDFMSEKIYAGDNHNVCQSKQGQLYSWGGTVINKSWIQQSQNESKLKLMQELNRRRVAIVDLSYSNTIIITGQDS